MFRLPVEFLYNLAPPTTPSEHFSQCYLRCCPLGLSPKNFCQIKHNPQLLGCEYFLSRHIYICQV